MSFEPINEKSTVIHRLSNDWIILQDETVRLDSMLKRIQSRLDVSNGKKRTELLNGIPAEILQEGGQWQRGQIKVNISIEFCPETNTLQQEPEPESHWPVLEEEVKSSVELEESNWPPNDPVN